MEKKILIIDNEKPICDTLELLLSDNGYDVFKAYDGKEGMRRLFNVSPDLIVLDIFMPGLNGFQVCSKIRNGRFYKNIPILMMSAIGSSENKNKGYDSGINDFIAKPFNNGEFIKRIELLLKSEQKDTLT